MENAGVPSVVVVTEPFGFKARAEVKALGMPALPIQVLPHPIGQIPNDQMRVLTDQAYDEVIFGLTAGADEVAKAYEAAVGPRSAYLPSAGNDG